MSALSRLLDGPCARHPDKLAVIDGARTVSFAGLRDASLRAASSFAAAGLAGERIATLLPNSIELLICYLGCWAAGAILVPFEYVDAPPEIRFGVGDCGARWLVAHEEKLTDLEQVGLSRSAVERIFVVGTPRAGQDAFSTLLATGPHALAEVPEDRIAFILYTSGSTALPKGVTHSHASAGGIAGSVLAALDRVSEDSRMVVHDSISHMGGWIEAFPLLHRGASIALARDFEVDRFYADLRGFRPTVIGAHVDHLWQIVRHPGARREDFASVDTVFTGGDELPVPLQRAFLDLTGLPIEVGWGMTEAIWLTIARTPELRWRGFLGRPVANVQVRVVARDGRDVPQGESGELWVKGPMVSPGYWNRPEADREVFVDGWLRTGDLGLVDADGDYWFTGRSKQVIERNSENITPGEIEQALYRHPDVAEAGAFGVADPDEGQVPIAYVSFTPGRFASEQDLKVFLATQIAAFKIPARILPIDRMPLTHSGKIDHRALAELYAKAIG